MTTKLMKLLLATTLGFLMILAPAGGAEPKTEAGSFPAFWRVFKEAVQKKDKEAVARMTKFPFMAQYRSQADFIKAYGQIIDEKARRCFRNAKPIKDEKGDGYSVFCGEEIFSFRKENGEYRFTDVGMND